MTKKTRAKKSSGSASNKSTRPAKLYRPQITRRELADLLTFAKGLARSAGALALSFHGRANPTLRYDHNLVTEADLAVQDYIRTEVKATYPHHKFLDDDRGGQPGDRDLQSPLWVVDPVDGSAGFSKGMPVWGISICLFDGIKPVLGIIHLPVTGEVYSATSGSEAMLNDRPIEVGDEAFDNESLVLTYSRFHSDYTTHLAGKVRSLGSTAAHMAYVARGAASAAVLGNVHVWDLAAGWVILEAAGGAVRDLAGKKVDLSDYLTGEKLDRVLVAAAKGMHREIGSLLEPR